MKRFSGPIDRQSVDALKSTVMPSMSVTMIALTRLNNDSIVVSALHILTIEETPDTLLTLINGEKITVKNSVEEVVSLATRYYATVGRTPSVVPAKKPESQPWT